MNGDACMKKYLEMSNILDGPELQPDLMNNRIFFMYCSFWGFHEALRSDQLHCPFIGITHFMNALVNWVQWRRSEVGVGFFRIGPSDVNLFFFSSLFSNCALWCDILWKWTSFNIMRFSINQDREREKTRRGFLYKIAVLKIFN